MRVQLKSKDLQSKNKLKKTTLLFGSVVFISYLCINQLKIYVMQNTKKNVYTNPTPQTQIKIAIAEQKQEPFFVCLCLKIAIRVCYN